MQKIYNAISWVFSVFFLISGIAMLKDSVFGGLCLLIISLLYMPPLKDYIFEKTKKSIPIWLKIILTISLITLAAVQLPQQAKPVQEQEKSDQTIKAIQEKAPEQIIEKPKAKPIQKTEKTISSDLTTDTFDTKMREVAKQLKFDDFLISTPKCTEYIQLGCIYKFNTDDLALSIGADIKTKKINTATIIATGKNAFSFIKSIEVLITTFNQKLTAKERGIIIENTIFNINKKTIDKTYTYNYDGYKYTATSGEAIGIWFTVEKI